MSNWWVPDVSTELGARAASRAGLYAALAFAALNGLVALAVWFAPGVAATLDVSRSSATAGAMTEMVLSLSAAWRFHRGKGLVVGSITLLIVAAELCAKTVGGHVGFGLLFFHACIIAGLVNGIRGAADRFVTKSPSPPSGGRLSPVVSIEAPAPEPQAAAEAPPPAFPGEAAIQVVPMGSTMEPNRWPRWVPYGVRSIWLVIALGLAFAAGSVVFALETHSLDPILLPLMVGGVVGLRFHFRDGLLRKRPDQPNDATRGFVPGRGGPNSK